MTNVAGNNVSLIQFLSVSEWKVLLLLLLKIDLVVLFAHAHNGCDSSVARG